LGFDPGKRLRARASGDFARSAMKSFCAQNQQQARRSLLPVLGDVKGPLELEVLLLVVVDEGRYGVVVTASEHARGGLFLVDYTILLDI
jgi:hypothetical protein